jgi:hypothetical protein
MLRAYVEGVAALHLQKTQALKIIAKYARLADPRRVQQIYADATTYLDRVPRVEPEGVYTILEFMGKKVPLETLADNSLVDRMVREDFVKKLYQSRG